MVPHLAHANPIDVVVTARVYMQAFVKTQREKRENNHCLRYVRIYLHVVTLGLTFAGLDALKPLVISVAVTGTSAVFKPSTARSTTTDSSRFLEHATFRAHHLIGRCDSSCGCAEWCSDWRADYF